MNFKPLRPLFSLVLVVTLLAASANAVTIATVPVGFPGNAPDTAVMDSGTSGYGAVPYIYRMGTYDVTNAQYAEFLNAKASVADPYGLWNSLMTPGVPDPTFGDAEGAIIRTGSGPYSYSVKPGFASKPVVYVSWYDAIRFVNWLQNGQGGGDTESGTYTIINGGSNSGTVVVPDVATRNSWASTNSFHWLLPSENEWYKAAYYNPSSGTYYAYPFQSNSMPAALAPPGNSNSGNFGLAANNYDGNGSLLSDVGAYPNSLSPFGSFDMGGDVFQWNEGIVSPFSRGVRGSFFASSSIYSAATHRDTGGIPTTELSDDGFRVASVGGVPEPVSIVLASLGVVGLLIFSKRLRASVCSFAEHRRASGG